jgi:hypothetical protein
MFDITHGLGNPGNYKGIPIPFYFKQEISYMIDSWMFFEHYEFNQHICYLTINNTFQANQKLSNQQHNS